MTTTTKVCWFLEGSLVVAFVGFRGEGFLTHFGGQKDQESEGFWHFWRSFCKKDEKRAKMAPKGGPPHVGFCIVSAPPGTPEGGAKPGGSCFLE